NCSVTRRWLKVGIAAFLAVAAIADASWRAGQRPYLTPGHQQIFYEESNFAALAGFVVFLAGAGTGLWALVLWITDRKFREAARTARVSAFIIVPYLTASAITSLTTHGTVVNIGDSYCYDLWCLGVNQVSVTPQGHDLPYTADVRIFVDSTHPHH